MSSARVHHTLLRVDNQLRNGTCSFAGEAEAKAVAAWGIHFADLQSPAARDAAEFGALASKRWHYYRGQNSSVNSVAELKQKIAEDPFAEVALMAVVKADWFDAPGILGVCHFRRTWCNNLFVDFLTTQPEIAGQAASKISGVGTALLVFIVEVADEIQSPSIWGETTRSSASFYKKTLNQPRETDAFRFVRRHYRPFLTKAAFKHLPELKAIATKAIAEAKERGILPES